jgi:hypothetical protein
LRFNHRPCEPALRSSNANLTGLPQVPAPTQEKSRRPRTRRSALPAFAMCAVDLGGASPAPTRRRGHHLLESTCRMRLRHYKSAELHEMRRWAVPISHARRHGEPRGGWRRRVRTAPSTRRRAALRVQTIPQGRDSLHRIHRRLEPTLLAPLPHQARFDRPCGAPNHPRRRCGDRARIWIFVCRSSSWSIQEALNLPALLPNAMGLVPVYLSSPD